MAKLPVGAWVMAQKLAATFVAGHLPNGKVLEGLAFPGHDTFDYGRKRFGCMAGTACFSVRSSRGISSGGLS